MNTYSNFSNFEKIVKKTDRGFNSGKNFKKKSQKKRDQHISKMREMKWK